MLNYFRINDLSRLITLAVILLAIRLPFFLFGDTVSGADMRYLLLGEKIASGDWLYTDIITSVSLLSGLFYGFLVWVFGKSIIVFHVVAYLITIIQVFLFNNLVTENRATINQTYYPGLLYGIFISIFPGSFALSPFLIGQTFLLIAMNHQFNHLEFKVKRDEKIILIGILISIFSLFEGAASLYILTAYLVFILYTNTLFRRYLLMAIGFVLPYFIIWGVFVLSGSPSSFIGVIPDLFHGNWNVEQSFLWLAIIPLLFLLLFLRQAIFGGRFTNYQTTLNFAMIIWALSSMGVFWLSQESAYRSFVLLVPILALYGSHYFLSKKRRFSFILLFLGMLLVNSVEWYRPAILERWVPGKVAHDNPYRSVVDGKSVLVLGEGYEFYEPSSSHASVFFDWDEYREIFERPVDYYRLRDIYSGLSTDYPDIIIDREGLFDKFYEHLPEVQRQYRKRGDTWVRLNN